MSLTALSAAYAHAEHPVRYFDIPAQRATDALNAFSKQSGLRLLFSFDRVEGRSAPAIRGQFSAEDVLERLLAGSGLVYEITPDAVVLIRDPRDAAARAPQLQPASLQDRAFASRPILLAQADARAEVVPSTEPGDRAQAGDAGHFELEEVIVTAQKKAQSAIDVPISLTTLGSVELEALRVQSTEDFAFSIPNLTYTNFGALEGAQISIRGISQFGGSRFDPVGVSVDDVSFGATDSSPILSTRFFDYERIEVLRGPQGTLSGRGSMGGAINIVSAKPQMQDYEFKGTLDLSRFNTSLVKGVINVPLSERTAIRTVGYVERSDGAVRNVGPAGGNSGYDNYGGRVAVRWLPTERLTIDAALGYEQLDNQFDTDLARDIYIQPGQREERIAVLAALGGNYFDTHFISDSRYGNNGGNILADTPTATDVEHLIGSLKVSYELGDHTLDFNYGHFEREADSLFDSDRSEYAAFRRVDRTNNEADSFEVRLTSDRDAPLNWVAGVSYLDEINQWHGWEDAGDGVYAGSYPDETRNMDTYQNLIDMRSWGVYGNVFWDFAQRWHLSAGVRWSRDETTWGNAFSETGPGLPALDGTNLQEGTATEINPRVALNFDFAENATAYFQFATGYRSGFANPGQAVQAGLAPALVDGESLKNYELGVKGRFLDNRAEVSADVFFMDYTDLQIGGYAYVDDQLIYFSNNAGEASARGFELEAAAKATERLELRAAVGYVDSKLSDDTLATFFGEELDDPTIPNTKPWTVSAAAIYTRQITNGIEGSFRIDHRRQSHSFEDFAQNPADLSSAFQVTDINIGIATPRWSVSAYFENVFDETYWLSTGTGDSLRGTFVGFIPRTFGLRFTTNFSAPAD